jgi:hypothetical protein
MLERPVRSEQVYIVSIVERLSGLRWGPGTTDRGDAIPPVTAHDRIAQQCLPSYPLLSLYEVHPC